MTEAPQRTAKITRTEAGDFLTLTTPRGVTEYLIRKIPAHPAVAQPPTWELCKLDGQGQVSERYHVHQDVYGWHCDCADATFRRQNTPEKCKHCRALEVLGLLEDNDERT